MSSLKEDEKRFIVQRFAMYETPQEIADAVNDLYGKAVTRQQVHKYNPKYNNIKDDLLELFQKTREEFNSETGDIAVAQKTYRLKELDRLYQKQKSSKVENVVEARATLEQAAKESGDVFTNKQKIEHRITDVRDKSDDELEQRRAELLKKSK